MNFDFTPRPITDLAQRMSELTGAPVNAEALNIEKIRAAMSEGVMLRIRCSAWTGETKLERLDAVNMHDGDGYISSAVIRLIGSRDHAGVKQRVAAVKNSAAKHGLKIEGYSGLFLPADRWPKFKAEFDVARAELRRVGAILCDKWESLRDQARHRIGRLADNAWPNYRADWNDLGEQEPGYFANHDFPSDIFREYIVEKYVSKIPHPDVMITKFDASYSLSVLHVPELEQQLVTLSKHTDLIESLRQSLEVQKNGLPYQFAAAVVKSLLNESHHLREYLTLERPNFRLTVALGRCMRFVNHWHELNLISDSTLSRELRNFEIGVKKIAARSSVKRAVNAQDLFDLVSTLVKNIERILSDIKVT